MITLSGFQCPNAIFILPDPFPWNRWLRCLKASLAFIIRPCSSTYSSWEYNQKSFYDNSSSHSLTLYCNSNCMNSVNSVITTNMFLQEELRGWKLGWTFQKCFEIPFKILSTANLFERKISRKVSESLLIIKPSNVKWKCKLPIYLFTKYLNGHLNIWDVSWFFAESLSWSSISFAPRAKT